MKLRKFAAMTMAVAMLGGTLAGCGGAASSTASSSADSTPAESTSTAESTETSGEKVNIKLFTGKIETIDVMNEIIDEFNASQDHIVVEQEYQKDASNVIKIKFASNEVPDIMTTYEQGFVDELDEQLYFRNRCACSRECLAVCWHDDDYLFGRLAEHLAGFVRCSND